MERYIVMTSAARMPSSCWGRYRHVAVVETDGVNMPSQIHPRHKAVRKIVAVWSRCNVGRTYRCAYARALVEARQLAARLNTAA